MTTSGLLREQAESPDMMAALCMGCSCHYQTSAHVLW